MPPPPQISHLNWNREATMTWNETPTAMGRRASNLQAFGNPAILHAIGAPQRRKGHRNDDTQSSRRPCGWPSSQRCLTTSLGVNVHTLDVARPRNGRAGSLLSNPSLQVYPTPSPLSTNILAFAFTKQQRFCLSLPHRRRTAAQNVCGPCAAPSSPYMPRRDVGSDIPQLDMTPHAPGGESLCRNATHRFAPLRIAPLRNVSFSKGGMA